MLFNSLHFLIFFPIVVTLYFIIPHRFRWILLLTSSYYFYMSWKAEYAILIMISTLAGYFTSQQIEKAETTGKKKLFLSISLIANLGMLFGFKYFNFFNESISRFLQSISIPFHPLTLKVLLPVGISFFTFQTLSYSIDVYRGKIKPEKNLGKFALYISFFPQLVAGPIERAENLLPQLHEKHYFEYKRVTDGLKLMLWGFFKKVVIADRLAIVINTVYNNVGDYTGIPLLLATVFFSFQIYCDFSGYTDIAIGAAQVMGVRLMDNFKRPYHSKSPAEFWRRWHISLSSWFQDYVFNPLYLKISKLSYLKNWSYKIKHTFSFGATVLIGLPLLGLWHGANWTFVLFGAYHGIFVLVYYLTRRWWDKLHYLLRIGLTFSIISFSWVFFRANSLSDVVYVLKHLFTGWNLNFYQVHLNVSEIGLIITILFIIFMEIVHFLQRHIRMRMFLSDKPIWLRWTVYSVIVLGILIFGEFEGTPFIYFQF